jgi:hypothetical protein
MSMSFEAPNLHNQPINIPRLMRELAVTAQDMRLVASLAIPTEVSVTSGSPIKTAVVRDSLRVMRPGEVFRVTGHKVPSDVPEQPIGRETIQGALNRIRNGENLTGVAKPTAWFSVENGLFRRAHPDARSDMSTEFDPRAGYEDRAVAAILLPGHPVVTQISPLEEAVLFPNVAVHAAYNAEGGFARHTAGSMMVEMGMVSDGQNPHADLTIDRPGGLLTRQDQMARVVIRGLVALARSQSSDR